jgi:hypothetical protein
MYPNSTRNYPESTSVINGINSDRKRKGILESRLPNSLIHKDIGLMSHRQKIIDEFTDENF